MKRIKLGVIIIGLLVLITFSISVASEPNFIKDQQTKHRIGVQEQINNGYSQQTQFLAEITFILYVGDGCGCHPIEGASITALGLDIDHNDSGVTDEFGVCILQLEIKYNYKVQIEADGFQNIVFDFLVVDDQTFTFHLAEKEVNYSHGNPFLERFPNAFPILRQLLGL